MKRDFDMILTAQNSADIHPEFEFDLRASQNAKEQGMGQAACAHAGDLNYARQVARRLALAHPERECTADDVQAVLIPEGIHLGNSAGSLFRKENGWIWTGRFVKSKRISNHATLRRVWRLNDSI